MEVDLSTGRVLVKKLHVFFQQKIRVPAHLSLIYSHSVHWNEVSLQA